MLTTTVIVAMHNEENYLPLLLDSLLRQSHQADEIILCDNLSTDNSIKIAISYQDKLPIKIIHQTTKGITPTLEKTWRQANGELIIRTDADAILPPNYIKNCLHFYQNNPNIQASTGPMFSAEFHIIYSFLYIFGTFICNYVLSLFRGYPLIIGPNTVIRHSALKTINGYQTAHYMIDDHLLTSKLHEARYQTKYVINQYNYHSIRRWLSNPLNILRSIAINFNDKFYTEKSTK